MKILPVIAKGIEVGFSIEAESFAEKKLLNLLTSRGDHWKGWQIEPGKLMVYPEPNRMPGAIVH